MRFRKRMGCKRSLYCWKNGPCASDQTRKQIWEDNIRFRESLRDINQSDHYWSFQISKNRCLCLEGEELLCDRSLSRKFRSASLQRLHQIDCASVTHDCNGLKYRNCYVHCPIHDQTRHPERCADKRTETPVPQNLTKRENALPCPRYPFRTPHKSDEDKSQYCHRYKNTLSNSALRPNMKIKFSSHSNLNAINGNKNLAEKKPVHASCENIRDGKAQDSRLPTPTKTDSEEKKAECEVKAEEVVTTKNTELKPVSKFPNRDHIIRDYTPISRTTRKMLSENKNIPFVTYGCNNNNLDIGSKRTHNVLASKLEVYPNALSAKQQKKNMIMKYIQSEKDFQKKCFPEDYRRRFVNHSSLWSLDSHNREGKILQRKNTKYILPVMSKPPKKINIMNQLDSGYYKTHRKPQIYFY